MSELEESIIEAALAEELKELGLEQVGPTYDLAGNMRVPSGYIWLDELWTDTTDGANPVTRRGRWADPKTLELITVLRDGVLIKRRVEDLLPYDELVS